MIARNRGRMVKGMVFVLAALGVLGSQPAWSQSLLGGRLGTKKAAQEPAPPASSNPADGPRFELTAVPVNPIDPIAIVNGEVISRQQLADECVARRGEEILETLIARKLIEQALKARKLEVGAAEIDQEIDNVANRVAHVGREAWLRTLDKERGISPVQYARDIIYPALALRKLSAERVQVTPQDLKNAFEAQYGDKLRCRLIMVDNLQKAREIWEELRKNPGGFEKLAQERSMDSGSRSLGGLLAEPITRHAYPQNVSDAAFRQLVDGDPGDKDPAHKPKDGDFTGPIQVAEATWVLLRRESVIPAQNVDPNDENVRKITYEMIYEVKLKEAMGAYFVELMRASAIDNKLTGHIKLANEEMHPDHKVDGEVKLMSNPGQGTPPSAASAAPNAKVKVPAPAALSPEVRQQAESLQRAPGMK
ncbi:MAG: peptidylprolyl isomerase [Planctomycetaceae bacterium]|nr:peptidylprolyl isomerase [Planctomycetaceae bacterium]MBV8314335.1 peptidylprolyl isomerase [Planctomycetaceae bacterium]